MILILGLVVLIAMTVFSYKTAKDYEKNAVVWGLVTFGVGIFLQLILPFTIGIILGIIIVMNGKRAEDIQQQIPAVTISVVTIILNIAAGFLIIRHLAKIPEEASLTPPQPPVFDNEP